MAQSATASCRSLPGHVAHEHCHFSGRTRRYGPGTADALPGRIQPERTEPQCRGSTGAMVRIRRGHYALPREASDLRRAREADGLLSCVSAAPSYGLWTLVPTSKLHLCVGHRATAARLRGAWPLPAVPAPVVSCGRTGRRPDPRSALPARTGSPRHGPVRCGPRGHQPAFLRGNGCGGNRNARARSVLELVIPRADSLIGSPRQHCFPPGRAPGADAGRDPRSGGGRLSALRSASLWRPTANRIWNRGR